MPNPTTWFALEGVVYVAGAHGPRAIAQCLGDLLTPEERQENAQAIAHRLTGHQELVAALEALLDEAQGPDWDYFLVSGQATPVLTQARAALANAKEGAG